MLLKINALILLHEAAFAGSEVENVAVILSFNKRFLASSRLWLKARRLHYFQHERTKLRTVEPRYNKGPRDWQNLFASIGFLYFEVLFHIFYYNWGKGKRSF